MTVKPFAIAVAALFLIVGSGRTETTQQTMANEQAFYESLTFGPSLRSTELYASLDRFAGGMDRHFVARYFNGHQQWPQMCAGVFSSMGGSEVMITLSGQASSGDGGRYYVAVRKGGSPGDFGVLSAKDDRLSVYWYHCNAEATHSLHTTQERKHYLLKVEGQPMLAWSLAN